MGKKIARSTLIIFVMIIAICSFSACKKHEEGAIGEVVVTFIEDYYFKNDLDKAALWCDKEVLADLTEEMEELKLCFTEEDFAKIADASNFTSFNVTTEELTIKGDSADVKVTIKMPSGDVTNWEYTLKKTDGKWKVVAIAKDNYEKGFKVAADKVAKTFIEGYYNEYRFGQNLSGCSRVCTQELYDTIKNDADEFKKTLEEGLLDGASVDDEISKLVEKAKLDDITVKTDKIVVRWNNAAAHLIIEKANGEAEKWACKLEKGNGWKVTSFEKISD